MTMSVVIVDSEIGTQAHEIQDALNAMAVICDSLARTIDGVTMPHGGLESSNMKNALRERIAELEGLAAHLRETAGSVSSEARSFLADIDAIDDFVY